MKRDTIIDGAWVRPVLRGFRMRCCDCGLEHRMDFRVVTTRKGRLAVQFRAFRRPRKKKA